MEKTDVLIIGGSASGIVTAVTGKSSYPDKDFMVIRKEKQAIVPCGIPYIFGSLESSEKDILNDAVLEKAGVGLKVDEAISVDINKKICINCRECVFECPFGGMLIDLDGRVFKCEFCEGDPECVKICPENAIVISEI